MADRRVDRVADGNTNRLAHWRANRVAHGRTNRLANQRTHRVAHGRTDRLAHGRTNVAHRGPRHAPHGTIVVAHATARNGSPRDKPTAATIRRGSPFSPGDKTAVAARSRWMAQAAVRGKTTFIVIRQIITDEIGLGGELR
jgi:hypothetical protein